MSRSGTCSEVAGDGGSEVMPARRNMVCAESSGESCRCLRAGGLPGASSGALRRRPNGVVFAFVCEGRALVLSAELAGTPAFALLTFISSRIVVGMRYVLPRTSTGRAKQCSSPFLRAA
uniref:Uncharacterized protein n=1 Tax=Ralstonia solanacearum TaxID=305 RepID=A0A0S4WJD7_RALSL|nr:protein of unknown function [Ralstonia solanacearum]